MTTATGNQLEAICYRVRGDSERSVPAVLVIVRSADEPAEVRSCEPRGSHAAALTFLVRRSPVQLWARRA